MLKSFSLTGLIAAPHTPFHEDGSLNLDMVPLQADHLVSQGVQGVFVAGTTGESQSMALEERLALVEAWSRAIKARLALVVHVGSNSNGDASYLAKHARDCGAQAIAACSPSFFKPLGPDILVEFHKPIADAVPGLPFYHYHIPSFTGSNGQIGAFLRSASEKIPNLAGVKFSHTDLADLLDCMTLEGGKFDILFGCDEMLLGALALGIKGAVGSTYNIAPKIYQDMIEAFNRGDLAQARALQLRSVRLVQLMNEFGGLAGGKALMGQLGIECGPVRAPLVPLAREQVQALREKFLLQKPLASFENGKAPAVVQSR